MDKILSIIIPTYNMEKYISRCIDSLFIKSGLDKIEILIINDGSKDRSLEIALNYRNRFPNSINVVDKRNGNYGSCINAGLEIATGKFVKILDSDDFFNTSDFEKLIAYLEKCEADAVLTNHAIITPKTKMLWKHPYQNGDIIQLSEQCPSYFPMHSVLYRTGLLRQINYRQTEGISYTDQEWILYPMLNASKLQYFDLDIYQYCMDREGQTMDPTIFAKGLPMLYRILVKALESLSDKDFLMNGARKKYRDMQLLRQAEVIYRQELVFNQNVSKSLRDLDNKLKISVPSVYNELAGLSIGFQKYVKMYRESHKGLSLCARKTLPFQKIIIRVLKAFKSRIGKL